MNTYFNEIVELRVGKDLAAAAKSLQSSWLSMLWSFQEDSKRTQQYMYVYPFSPKHPPTIHKFLMAVVCQNHHWLLKKYAYLSLMFKQLIQKISGRTYLYFLKLQDDSQSEVKITDYYLPFSNSDLWTNLWYPHIISSNKLEFFSLQRKSKFI